MIIGAVFGNFVRRRCDYLGGAVGFCHHAAGRSLLARDPVGAGDHRDPRAGLVNGVVAISMILIPVYARLCRGGDGGGQIASSFVQAAVTLGAGLIRIMATHRAAQMSSPW